VIKVEDKFSYLNSKFDRNEIKLLLIEFWEQFFSFLKKRNPCLLVVHYEQTSTKIIVVSNIPLENKKHVIVVFIN